MFCGRCGANNDDSAVFCAECGASFEVSQPVAPATPSKPGFKLDNRKIGIIAVAAIAVLALILGFMIFGGRSYKATVKDYFKAMEKGDAKAMMKLIPDGMIKAIMEEEDLTKKEMTEQLQDMLDMMQDRYDKIKISYEITDTDKVDKDDLKDLKEEFKDEYKIKVKDAMTVEVDVTMKVDGEKMEQEMELYLIKVGGSWYLASFDSLF